MRCQSIRAGSRLQRVLKGSSRLIEHVCTRFGQGPRNKAAENVACGDATYTAIRFAKRCEASQGETRYDVFWHIRISQFGLSVQFRFTRMLGFEGFRVHVRGSGSLA